MKNCTILCVLLTITCLLSSCGIIRKLKTRHEVKTDSAATTLATHLTETRITEQAHGTVPYQVASITAPVTTADTTPVQYVTPDYALQYTPPRPGHNGSIAVAGKKAAVPVSISKTTDVKETDAAATNTHVAHSDVAVSKEKSSNTIPLLLLCLAVGLLLAFLAWRLRKKTG